MEGNETRTLWISIGAAIFAVVLLYGWAQNKRATYARTFGQTETVVVALKDIRESEIVDESMLEVVEKPSDFIQPSAIQNPTEVVGQIALAPIKKGEQILNTKLVFPDKSTGLSMQVSPGKRAITVPVNEVQSVGRLIKSGDRVDLLGAVDEGSGLNKKRKIKTIFQDVPVLAVGQSIVDNLPITVIQGDSDFEVRNLRVENNYNTITIEVSPAEAQKLFYLRSVDAPYTFALRNPNDQVERQLPSVEINDVLNKVKFRAPAKKEPKPAIKKPTPKPKTTKKRGRYESI